MGTDAYMAPEVRWAKQRKAQYGVSCDWYTVGVLMYELSAKRPPYDRPWDSAPQYVKFNFPEPHAGDLVKKLLEQDHSKRLGSGPNGVREIHRHAYWRGVEWELVPLKAHESPCKGLSRPSRDNPKQKLEGHEEHGDSEFELHFDDDNHNVGEDVTTDDDIDVPREEKAVDNMVDKWDFVAPTAVVEEYMERLNGNLHVT